MSGTPAKRAILIIGDFTSRCGTCGEPALPSEEAHQTVATWPERPGPTRRRQGCGVRYSHVAAAPDAHEFVAAEARRMRPDLEYLDGEVSR